MKEKTSKPKTKKKAAAPKKPRARKAPRSEPAARAPHIDFPREGERIRSAHYAFRIDAAQEGCGVEISIDSGPWQECRAAVGYWWFDWTGFSPGPHEIECRLKGADGVTGLCVGRRCFVEL